jgi:uncharacterized protein YutE (UPF0331/DUF86 family)
MSDHDRICNKLDKLHSYYTELKSLSLITQEEYMNNSIYRRAVERTMQLIVECANNMLLKVNGQKGGKPQLNVSGYFVK